MNEYEYSLSAGDESEKSMMVRWRIDSPKGELVESLISGEKVHEEVEPPAGSWWVLAWRAIGGEGWTSVRVPGNHTHYNVYNLVPGASHEFTLRLELDGEWLGETAECVGQTIGLPVFTEPAKLAAV